nr:zf-CCHC domain-containing protein/UBN2 domain-containing protein [Tanacetum cinerariifolium]
MMFQRSRDEKNRKSDRKCFRCGNPNHLIGECPKPPKDKNQRAFVKGSWSDSDEEDDEKVKHETCLVAHASNEVCSKSSYFSDENSSIDDLALDNEYDKLCKMSLKIITKNKKLKATRNSLENELRELKIKLSTLEKNNGVNLVYAKCHTLIIENEKLKEESTRQNKFEKSTHCLNEMLSNQKPSGDKLSLGFNSFETSSSGTKEIKFVKAQKKALSDGGESFKHFIQDVNDEEPTKVEEVLKVVIIAKLITKVVTTARATTTAEATKVSVPRRRRGILIEEPKSLKDQAQIEQDEAFSRQLEAELNANINWNSIIEQFKRSERLNDAVMKYQTLKRKPLTEAQARKNMIIYLKNMAGYKMNYFKGMTYSEIRLLFEKHYNYNQAFLEEVNEEVTVPEEEVEVECHKREGESLEKEITKKQKMDEEA